MTPASSISCAVSSTSRATKPAVPAPAPGDASASIPTLQVWPASVAGPLPQILVKARPATPMTPMTPMTPTTPTVSTTACPPMTAAPTPIAPIPTATPSGQMLPPPNPPSRSRHTTEGDRSRSHNASPYSKSVPPQRRGRARSRTPPPISRRDSTSDNSITAASNIAASAPTAAKSSSRAPTATKASSRRPRSNRSPLPRSRSSAPSAPAHPDVGSSSRSMQLRPNPQAHPPLILLPNPESDPWRNELQVLAAPYLRDGIPVNQEQMDYVAATLNAAGIPSQHSTLNYAKVNPEHHFYKITPHWFMLTVPYLGATVRLKEPTKTRPMLLWTHASSVGGTRGILRSRQIHPSRQHSSECPAFYAQGWKITGHADYDAEEIARTMSQNWSMSFNMAQLLLFGRAVGTCQPIRSGGEQACIEALDSSERPDVIHYVSGKCWMVIPEASQIVGLAWPTDTKPPTGVLRS